jgi:hypothetical protein
MLARAEARASNRTLTLRQMSAEQLVFASASFDAVIMSCVLTVVEDPQQTLAEAARGSRSHPVAHQGDWPHPLRMTTTSPRSPWTSSASSAPNRRR